MDDQSSTESLLRHFESLREDESSVSTQLLLGENRISNSTESLVHEHVRDLLDRVHLEGSSPPISEFSSSAQSQRSPPDTPILKSSEAAKYTDISRDNMIEPSLKTNRHWAEELDPILTLIFNKIQVFLLRNRMSLDFLKIFKSYVNHLIESGLHPLDDQYFLTLQNELSEGYEFTPTMEQLLNCFLIKPENLIMRLALFEHKIVAGNLRRYLETWKLHHELTTNLIKLESVWEEYLQRKYISLWFRKYEKAGIQLVTQADDFNSFTLLSFSFDNWLIMLDTSRSKTTIANQFFVSHIFRRFKKKMKAVTLRTIEAKQKSEKQCLAYYLRSWKLRHLELQYKQYSIDLKRRVLSRLKAKLHECQLDKNRAAFAEQAFLLVPFLGKWYKKAQKKATALDQLRCKEEYFLKKKAFSLLKDVMNRNLREYDVINRLDHLMIKYIFKKVWSKRFREQSDLYSFWSLQNKKVMTKNLNVWKERLTVKSEACRFDRSRSLLLTLTLWKRRLEVERFKKRRIELLQLTILRQWTHRKNLKKKLSYFEHSGLAKKAFYQWRGAYARERNALIVALEHNKNVIMIESLSRWSRRSKYVNDMTKRCDMYRKLRAFMAIKRGIVHMQDINEFASSCDPIVVCKGTVSRYLSFWKELALSHRRNRLEFLLEDHLRETCSILTKSYFHFWLRRVYCYHTEYAFKSELIYEENLKGTYFRVIKSKLAMNSNLLLVSEDIRTKSVLLNTFYSWKMRLDHLSDLNEKLETEIDKRNLALLLNFLNVWSMRILKARRNYETIQIFRKRWDRAGVRGALLLWKNRTDQSLSEQRWKATKENTHEPIPKEQQLALDSEMVTPTRGTTSRTYTIPGSEGVKRYRIEAMRSHYSRIRRAIPSPIKSSMTLNSTAKKKIVNDQEASKWNTQPLPPPRISLERINKNLAAKIDNINFDRIPEVSLGPFIESTDGGEPVIERSLLELDEETQYDDSPTRRT